MPIKEEPVRIKFQYDNDDVNKETFNIEYFSEKRGDQEKKFLKITPVNEDIENVFEVEFFVEVVEFLKKKGVIKVEHDEKEQLDTKVSNQTLPLPTINTKDIDEKNTVLPITNLANVLPVSSFSKTDVEALVAPTVETNVPIINEYNNSIPIIDRPVIRTKVGEKDDPMKALEESKRQRKTNPEKAIKRRDE